MTGYYPKNPAANYDAHDASDDVAQNEVATQLKQSQNRLQAIIEIGGRKGRSNRYHTDPSARPRSTRYNTDSLVQTRDRELLQLEQDFLRRQQEYDPKQSPPIEDKSSEDDHMGLTDRRTY